MGEARCIPITRFIRICVEIDSACSRHQQDVAVIRDPGAAQVRVAETVNDVIGVVVTGTPVPTCQSSIRTELHHTKRQCCTGKCVTMSAGSNEGIDESSQVGLARLRQTPRRWEYQ